MQGSTPVSEKKPTSRNKTRFLMLAGVAMLCVSAPQMAHAGFQWNPPQQDTAAQGQSVMPEPVDKEPARIQRPDMDNPQRPLSLNPSGRPARATNNAVEIEPIMARGAKDSAQTNQPPREPSYVFSEVQGFGRDIPLALALRQVVPPDFSFSFDGLAPGAPVSWQGGRGWNEILKDVLAEADAQAALNGNTITLMPHQRGEPRLAIANPPASILDQDTMMAAADQRETTSRGRSPSAPVSLVAPREQTRSAGRISGHHGSGQIWTAAPGERVTDILKDWTARENTELFWNVKADYTLESAQKYDGSLKDAVTGLLTTVTGQAGQLEAQIYPNLPDGPAVLLVRSVSPDNS